MKLQFLNNKIASRYLDPYSTTSELTYIPYTKDAQNGVAKKDIITYYDVLGLPKGPRGFGPRVSTHLLPNTFDPIEDKLIFKNKCRQRTVPFSMIAVPNSGATTEVRTNYSGRPEIPVSLIIKIGQIYLLGPCISKKWCYVFKVWLLYYILKHIRFVILKLRSMSSTYYLHKHEFNVLC